MRSRLRFCLCAVVLLLTAAQPAPAAVSAELLEPARAWSWAEVRLAGLPAVANPFDPQQIAVDATLTAPSGASVTVPGFWHQEFAARTVAGGEELTPDGPPHWRIRFTATEEGPHRLQVTVRTAGQPAPEPAELTFAVGPAAPGGPRGWPRVAADRRTFATSDGRPLLLAGHNVCWPGSGGTAEYDRYFAELAAAGQNFARLWLAPWWAPLEHVPGTLNRYRLDAAWQLDQVFAAAERHGLYLLLCLDHHGMYQPVDPTWGGSNAFWRTNPYSAEQGGPCARAADFFSLPEAREIYQKRLRYLIGRYAGHPRLLAWQFFNEIDNIFDRAPVAEAIVVDWHVAMARWLRAHDPYQHPIGTSLTGGVDRPAFWDLPEMEYTSYHAYWEPAPARRLARLAEDFTRRYQKPALIGEFGVNGGHWDAPADPHLRGLRQHLWAGALGGSAATALSWWWEDVHQDGALQLESVLVALLRQVGWFAGGWEPATLAGGGEPPKDLGEPLAEAAPFTAPLALNPFRRLRLDNTFAVANPLAAERASEHLSAVLWGTQQPEAQRPLRLTFWASEGSVVHLRVHETTGPAVLVARVDGTEVWRKPFAAAGPVQRDFTVPLTAGRHQVELVNGGPERIQLASVRLQGVRPASFPDNWRYRAEAFGLRRGDHAVLYAVAPRAVYPAGAIRYALPPAEGEILTLTDWRDGTYRVRWIDPETGRARGEISAIARDGQLRLALPPFSADLAVIVAPE